MPKLTPQQRAKLVRYFYLNGESPVAALRAYGRETGDYAACDAKLVKNGPISFFRQDQLTTPRDQDGLK